MIYGLPTVQRGRSMIDQNVPDNLFRFRIALLDPGYIRCSFFVICLVFDTNKLLVQYSGVFFEIECPRTYEHFCVSTASLPEWTIWLPTGTSNYAHCCVTASDVCVIAMTVLHRKMHLPIHMLYGYI